MKKKKSSASQHSRQEYNNFIKELEIENITIPSNSWRLYFYPPPKTKIQNEYNLHLSKPKISSDRSTVSIPAKLDIRGKVAKNDKNVFNISIKQNLKIRVNPERLTDEFLNQYVGWNGIISMISVFREQVKYATFQMGIHPLIIPTFKMIPPSSNEKNKNKIQK